MKITIDGEDFYLPDEINITETLSSINESQKLQNKKKGNEGNGSPYIPSLLGGDKTGGTGGTEEKGKVFSNQNSPIFLTFQPPAIKNKTRTVPLVPLNPKPRYRFDALPCNIKGDKTATDKWLDDEYFRLGFKTIRQVTCKSFWVDEEFVPE